MNYLLRKSYNICKRIIVLIALRFPLKERVIVESFLGKRHDDNILFYLDEFDETKMQIYYVQRYHNKAPIPKGKRLIKNGLRYIWLMHTSSLVITNSRLHSGVLMKRPGQKIMQFWHGIPWKKLVYDQENINFSEQKAQEYLAHFSADIRKWDYLWVPNQYAKNKLQSAFQYKGAYIERMYPADKKMQALQHSKQYMERIKHKLNIPLNKKVILYMPTFREHLMIASGRYKYYSNINVVELATKNQECVILLRAHYLIASALPQNMGNLLDVSDYEAIHDLYLISDILITDYSSAIYSFSLLEKPIISLQFDLAEYKQRRGLYADGITGMEIIEVKSPDEFAQLNLNGQLRKSKPKTDYYQ